MGNVLDLLPEFKDRRDQRQSLRLRINRRARELAERDQERYFRAMVFAVYSGKVDAELIHWWEPLDGAVGGARDAP